MATSLTHANPKFFVDYTSQRPCTKISFIYGDFRVDVPFNDETRENVRAIFDEHVIRFSNLSSHTRPKARSFTMDTEVWWENRLLMRTVWTVEKNFR